MEQNNRKEEFEIDLIEMLQVLLSKWVLILVTGIVCAFVAIILAKCFVTPTYTSTTSVYAAKNDDDEITYSELQISTQLTKDYVVLVTSRTVLEKVIDEMNLNISYESFLNKISVETPSDTRMLNISVTDTNPEMAMKIADEVRDTAVEHIKNVMGLETINVAEKANLPTRPSSMGTFSRAIIGAVLGMLVLIAILIIRYIADDSIKTPEDVEKHLGLSVLASIPLSEDDGKKKK